MVYNLVNNGFIIDFCADQGNVISPMVSKSSQQEFSQSVPTPCSSKAGSSHDTGAGSSQVTTPISSSHHIRSPRQLFSKAPESGVSVEATDASDILDEVDSDYDPEIDKVILKLGSSGYEIFQLQ